MQSFDLVIIGAGPAGYLAAERAAHEGFSVLLAEKNKIGGVCLNEGCIPSKTLLYSAKLFDGAVNGQKYGIKVENASLDHAEVIARKNKVVKKLVTGIKSKLKTYGVTVIEGSAMLLPKTIEGFPVSVSGETYLGKRLLIATGSLPIIPPIPGAKEALERGFALTNREILDLETIPEELVVIGGGVIGLEMASYFNSAGSKVTVIEMLDHIAGQTDPEISSLLRKNYEKKGVAFNLNSKVIEIKEGSVVYESDGTVKEINAGKVLLSIGRKPVTGGIGLEALGVELVRGAVKTDERMMTNIPGVYAAGDVNGKSLLAHTAYREAEVAVNNMLGRRDMVRYDTIPNVIYTNPEVASVGETEATAKEKGLEFDTVKLSMMYAGRYAAENEGGDGIFKLLVSRQGRKIIGAHMIGNPASEIIYGAGLMMENEMRIEDIKELVFPHPTISEIIREAVFEIK